MQVFVIALLLLSSLAILLHIMRHPSSRYLRGALAALSLMSLWVYSDYGQFHWIRNTPEMTAQTGATTHRALFHWHEVYHYYLGSKYYKELKNSGLYEAVALADAESAHPYITVKDMRDLSNATYTIPLEEGKERARTLYKPNFTPERWVEFKRDLEYMKAISAPDWLNLGMFDAGFNPPPTWNVIGYNIANLLPLSTSWFDYGPHWSQAEFLPLLDVALLMICALAIWRAFAFEGLCIFVIIFGTSFVSDVHWIAGSFLRYLFFIGMTLGVCFLQLRRFFWSGVFLGFAAWMVIFPGIFTVGAFIMLALAYWRDRTAENRLALKHYLLGVGLVSAILVGWSLIQFGFSYWQVFFHRILLHKDMFFVWHIGYKRIAVWGPEVPNQSFWWAEGTHNFRRWNQHLIEVWESQRYVQYPLIATLVVMCVLAMRFLTLAEGTLLFGGLVLFMLAIPANYYYLYMTLIPVTFFRKPVLPVQADIQCKEWGAWRNEALLFGFFVMWLMVYLVPSFGGDELTKNYHICVTIFVYFLFWFSVRFSYIYQLVERKKIGAP